MINSSNQARMGKNSTFEPSTITVCSTKTLTEFLLEEKVILKEW